MSKMIELQNNELIKLFKKIAFILYEGNRSYFLSLIMDEILTYNNNNHIPLSELQQKLLYSQQSQHSSISIIQNQINMMENENPLQKQLKKKWKFEILFAKGNNNFIFSSLLNRINLSIILCSDLLVFPFHTIQDNPFFMHLPSIFHCLFLEVDSQHVYVFQHSKYFLENLIFAIMNKNNILLPSFSIPFTKESLLFFKLKKIIEESPENQPLWSSDEPYEVSFDKMKVILNIILSILHFQPDLKKEWARIAFEFATNEKYNINNHLICRSFQIYRMLADSIEIHEFESISKKLLNSIKSRSPVNIQISLEIIKTLKILCFFPKEEVDKIVVPLFWVSVSMLHTVIPMEFIEAIDLLDSFISKINISEIEIQKKILSTIPTNWNPNFNGIINFLLKGLCSPKTESQSRKLLMKITELPMVQPLHVNKQSRILSNLLGLLPYLLTAVGRDDSIIIAHYFSTTLYLLGDHVFADLLKNYKKFTKSPETIRRFVHEIAFNISQLYFPDHETFTFSILVEMMEHGNPDYKSSILRLIEVLLTQIDLRFSTLNTTHLAILSPISKYIHIKSLWQDALPVIESILSTPSPNFNFRSKNSKQIPDLSELLQLQYYQPTWERPTTIEPLITALTESIRPAVTDENPEPFIPCPVVIKSPQPVEHVPAEPVRWTQITSNQPRTGRKLALGASRPGTKPVSKLSRESTNSPPQPEEKRETESNTEEKSVKKVHSMIFPAPPSDPAPPVPAKEDE